MSVTFTLVQLKLTLKVGITVIHIHYHLVQKDINSGLTCQNIFCPIATPNLVLSDRDI